MNKTLTSLLIAASLSFGSVALAQDTGAPDTGAECHGRRGGRGHAGHGGPMSAEGIEHRLTRMTEHLSLDAHQVTLVREIFTAAAAEGEAIRAAAPGPERRARFHALMESVHTRIDAVLTPAQRAQVEEMRSHRREGGAEHHGHGRGEGHRGGHRGDGAERTEGSRGI